MTHRSSLRLTTTATAIVCAAALLGFSAPARAASSAAQVSVLSESFSTGHMPAGWKVIDKDDGNPGPQPDNQGLWRFDDPEHDGNQTGGSGSFASLDSRSIAAPLHASLNSPYLTKGVNTVATVTFRTALVSAKALDYSRLQFSTDKGAVWTTVWSVSGTTSIAPGTLVTVVLPAAVTAAKHVTLRWDDRQYKTSYWQVDDVSVTTS